MFKCENFVYTHEHEVKHNGDMGMGHLWLIMGGAFMAYNGWGIYGLYIPPPILSQ